MVLDNPNSKPIKPHVNPKEKQTAVKGSDRIETQAALPASVGGESINKTFQFSGSLRLCQKQERGKRMIAATMPANMSQSVTICGNRHELICEMHSARPLLLMKTINYVQAKAV